MNQNNLLTFAVGAAIGGAAAYYAFKHKDEILGKIDEKIDDLEGALHIDRHEWLEKAKEQLDKLTQTFQSTVQRFSHGETEEAAKESEVAHILEELNKLRQEVHALSAN